MPELSEQNRMVNTREVRRILGENNFNRTKNKLDNPSLSCEDAIKSMKDIINKSKEQKKIDTIMTYLNKHKDDKEIEILSLEIERIGNANIEQTQIYREYKQKIQASMEGKRACIILGVPGAGKSISIRELGEKCIIDKKFIESAVNIDPDDIKLQLINRSAVLQNLHLKEKIEAIIRKAIPDYNFNEIADFERDYKRICLQMIHSCALKHAITLGKEARQNQSNFITQVTGGDFLGPNNIVESLKENGYMEITVVYVHAEANEVAQRIADRAKTTNRDVTSNYLIDMLDSQTSPYNTLEQTERGWEKPKNPEDVYRRLRDENTMEQGLRLLEGKVDMNMRFCYVYNGKDTKAPILVNSESVF